MTGPQLQSGNSRVFRWQAQLEGDRATTAIWELEMIWRALENSLSVALSTLSLAGWPAELAGPAGQLMFVLVYCAAVSGVACFPGFGPVLGCRYVVK